MNQGRADAYAGLPLLVFLDGPVTAEFLQGFGVDAHGRRVAKSVDCLLLFTFGCLLFELCNFG